MFHLMCSGYVLCIVSLCSVSVLSTFWLCCVGYVTVSFCVLSELHLRLGYVPSDKLRLRTIPCSLYSQCTCGVSNCPYQRHVNFNIYTQVSAWSKWTSCSKPCGFGESQRARIVKRDADHGGIPCPVLQATKSCNDFHCPVNCTVKKSVFEKVRHLKNYPGQRLE